MRLVWSWFLNNGFSPGSSAEQRRQVIYVNSFSLVAFVSMAVFGVLHLLGSGSFFVGLVEIAASVGLFLNLLVFRRLRSVVFASRVLLFIASSVVALMLITGGIENTGDFWLLVLLPGIYLLRSWREGLVWTGVLLVMISIIATLSWLDLLYVPYRLVEFRQLAASFIAVTVLMVVFERNRSAFEENIVSARELGKLREENIRVRRALDESIAGVMVVSELSRVTFVNTAFLVMLGYEDKRDFLGVDFTTFLPPKFKHEFSSILRSLKSGEEYVGDMSFLAKSGEKVYAWVRCRSSNDGKKFGGFVLTGRDITEQKREESRNKALLDALPDLYFRIREDGVIFDYHPSHVSQSDTFSDDVVGKDISHIFSSSVVQLAMDAVRQALNLQKVVEFEYSVGEGDAMRFFEAHVSPFSSKEVVVVVRDVSDRFRSQALLKRRVAELEKMNRVMIGRELRMRELKAEVARLKKKLA